MSDRMMKITYGILNIVVSAIFFPILFTAIDAIRTYAHIASFSIIGSIILIFPLMILFLVFGAGGVMVYQGATGKGGTFNMMQTVEGELVIFMGLTLFPLILAAFYTMIITDNGTYTGFSDVVPILALLILFTVSGLGGNMMLQGSGAGSLIKRHGKGKHKKNYR